MIVGPPTVEELARIGAALKQLNFGQPPDAHYLQERVEEFIVRWAPKGKHREFRNDFRSLCEGMGASIGAQLAEQMMPQLMLIIPQILQAIRGTTVQ